MDFPCEFVIKVMGSAEANLQQGLLPILNKHIETLQPQDIVCRDSTGGKYHSLTIRLTAHSQAQLDALYREISARPDVLMVL